MNQTTFYQIKSDKGSSTYIGYTTKDFSTAIQDLKKYYDNNKRKSETAKLFDKYGFENCEFVVLGKYQCQSASERDQKKRNFQILERKHKMGCFY